MIKKLGRPPKDQTNTEFLNVRISTDAKKALSILPRLERGAKINELILAWAEAQYESAEDLL